MESSCIFGTDYCAYPGFGCPEGWVANETCCEGPTPIIIDLLGNGIFLTDSVSGVFFQFGTAPRKVQISWTIPGSDDAWLVLDRNGNGAIDNGGELFGNITPQPSPPRNQSKNGFLALAVFDRADFGGNTNHLIDSGDSIFASLMLWIDANHDGVSQASELFSLASKGIRSISLYYELSNRRDRHDNKFRYRAKVFGTDGQHLGKWAWDVILRSTNNHLR